MIGLLIVTHCNLGKELLNAAEFIVGRIEAADAIAVTATTGSESLRNGIKEKVALLDQGAGVIILTDMFGGTPTNIGLTFLEANRIEVITGVNLPMLIKLARLQASSDLLGAAREIRDTGKSAIWVASDLMRAEAKG